MIAKPLDLLKFRLEVGEALTITPERKRKSPKDLNEEEREHNQSKQYKPMNLPVTDMRYDCYDHLVVFDDNIATPRICRLETVKAELNFCVKNVNLVSSTKQTLF